METQIQRNYYNITFYTEPGCSRPFSILMLYLIDPLSIAHTFQTKIPVCLFVCLFNIDNMATAAIENEFQSTAKAQRREPLILPRSVRKKSHGVGDI